jgi:polyhydroxyalkanoate synthase
LVNWRPELAAAAGALETELAAADPDEFGAALEREIRRDADALLKGLELYRHHPYRRAVAEPPVLWSEGTTRLLDYGPLGGAPLLVVPSLINRAYVLDLEEDNSFLRFLAERGIRPLLVDWGKPGEAERRFDLTDYVAGRLEAALEAAIAAGGAPVAVLGYCMGGTLAVALAQRRRRDVAALALLAAPWDFHAEGEAQSRLLGSLAEPLAAAFAALGEVPVDVLQGLFAALDPLLALKKFSRLAARDPASAETRAFVALEDWLNDGVAMALPAVRAALADWYGANLTARRLWKVAGTAIDPAKIGCPALVVVPGQDRIVPPGSARALAAALPRAQLLAPPLGHIGMVVGKRAPLAAWRPIAEWLDRHQGPPRLDSWLTSR